MILQQLQILKYSKSFLFSIGFLVFFVGVTNSIWAQTKEYASSYYDDSNVDDPENAVDGNETTKATLNSRESSLLPPVSKLNGRLGLRFTSQVDASQKAYVKVGVDDKSVLQSLLGGSLGGALTDLLDNLVLGSHKYNFSLLDNGTLIGEGESSDGFAGGMFRVMQAGDGNFLFEIDADDAFDEIRVDTRSDATLPLIGTGKRKFDIYDAYYFTSTGITCGRPIGTSFDGSGLDLSLLSLDDQHLNRAIDDDPDSYATLDNSSLLGLSVASSLSQYFYFPTVSAETASVNLKIGMASSGLLDLDLLGATEVVFYNGNEPVYERSLKSGLLGDTNALNLLDSGAPVMLTFAPGRSFDRIELRLNSPVGLNLLNAAFRIYDVQRYDDAIEGCENPEITLPDSTENPFDVPSCSSDLLDFDNVDFPHYAVDDNNESYATLYADSGEILGGGPTAGFIEMGLGETLPANKTTYVRIGYDEDVLDRLLGGSLGKLLSDLANNLLLGNQYIQVEAINGNDIVLNEDSSNAFEGNADGVVTIVEDKIGRYYLAITPDSEYDRIRITNHVSAVLPTGKKASLDVYNACFETGEDSCFPANFTSYKGGGINLSLGDLSDVGVKDPYKAISDNSSEYSEINLGVAGIAANVYQTVHFNQPSKEGDHVQIRLMVEPSSALSLDLLGAYKIKFFNGKDQVGQDYTLQEGLLNNIDLLALFSSGGTVTLDFEPEDTFDRVDIGAESIVALNVAAEPLRVYSVKRYGDECELSFVESPFDVPACISDLIDSQNADEVQNLLDEDFDSYATLKSGAGTLLGLGNKFEGYVEMGYGETIEPGITSYIRIDFDDGILEALIGGSLGNVVSGLLDGLALGDHYFTVDVKMDDDVVLSGSSKDAGAGGGNGEIRVVQDALGRFYIAVTPDEAYNRIRVTDVTDSALGLLAEPNTMNVYGMCTEFSTDACLPAFATSYEYSGISLSVNDLGGAGVTNPEYVLDNNTQHYSEISNGTLGVGATTKQWIYFNTVSSANDAVLIKFNTEGGGVDLDLLGSLEIKAYKGNDEVATLDWPSNGIVNGVNVLDLLSNGEIVEVPFAPGDEFDRISVGIKTLASASVFPPIHLYSVERCYDLDTYMISNPHIISKFKNN